MTPPEEQPVLRTSRLVLRPFALSDAGMIQQLAGDELVADTTLNMPHPYLDGMAESWILTREAEWKSGTLVAFAIEESGELRGTISLRLAPAHRRAETGYWIGRAWWGRGFATEAVCAILDFAFDQLKLNRVEATHFTRNPASGRVMEKAGMTREGLHRERFLKNGRFEDVVQYAILATDARVPILRPRAGGPA